jgi:hypothetical protein
MASRMLEVSCKLDDKEQIAREAAGQSYMAGVGESCHAYSPSQADDCFQTLSVFLPLVHVNTIAR